MATEYDASGPCRPSPVYDLLDGVAAMEFWDVTRSSQVALRRAVSSSRKLRLYLCLRSKMKF